mgnify:CR=1 FL=1
MYARQVGDRTLTFIVSGKLWRNSMIMQDLETGSLWSHVTGECLEGELEGTLLEMIPMVQTTWAKWVAAHTGTRVLKKSEEVKSSRYESYFTDPERTGIFRARYLRERRPGKDLVHGIVLGPHALAVPDERLPPGAEVEAEIDGTPLKITRDSDGGVRAVRTDTGVEIRVLQSYWFAWSQFYPNTAVVQ